MWTDKAPTNCRLHLFRHPVWSVFVLLCLLSVHPFVNSQEILATSEVVSTESAVGESVESIEPEKTGGHFSRELLEDLWPGALLVERSFVPVQGELRKAIVQRSRVKTPDQHTTLFRVRDEEGLEKGHVVILNELGKYRPITFLVALDAKDKVKDLQVLVYREHIGKEIESVRFTRQFRDKNSSSRLKLHRDIRNLSGATLSARAAVRAVRRALATVHETSRAGIALHWHGLSGPLLSYGDPLGGAPVPATGEDQKDSGKRANRKEIPEEDQILKVRPTSVERARPAMGTILKMEVYGEQANSALEAAFAEVERLEALHSRWRSGSDVLRVEAAPIGEPVQVASETLEVVEKALQMSRDSGGAFDLTLKKGGYRAVRLDREAQTIALMEPGLILDLGGIGKGYALDRAAKTLESHGCSSALLDFGGQLLALDPPPGESAWSVGIFDPRDGQTVLHSVPLVRSSLATTALYERGEHLVNLLDTDSLERILSTSVLSESATQADALSTTVALLSQDRAQLVLDNQPGASAVILIEGEDQPRVVGRLQR